VTPSKNDGSSYWETYSVFSVRIVKLVGVLIVVLIFNFIPTYAMMFADLTPIFNDSFKSCEEDSLPFPLIYFACFSFFYLSIIVR
jgi:hypothetical protein